MARKLAPATATTLQNIDAAVNLLKVARAYLRDAGCPKAARATHRALNSALGARRHAERRSTYPNGYPWKGGAK